MDFSYYSISISPSDSMRIGRFPSFRETTITDVWFSCSLELVSPVPEIHPVTCMEYATPYKFEIWHCHCVQHIQLSDILYAEYRDY